LLEKIEGDLSLCILSNKEQPLSSLKPLPMSYILSSGSMTMLILEFGVKLLEMLAIAVIKRVIFANSLIGATIQDDGKRKKS